MTDELIGCGACDQKMVIVPHKFIAAYYVENLLSRTIRELESQVEREVEAADYQTASNCQVVLEELKGILRSVKAIPAVTYSRTIQEVTGVPVYVAGKL